VRANLIFIIVDLERTSRK